MTRLAGAYQLSLIVVFTLDCESFKLQLGNGEGNWYEVQITGRRRSLPGRTCLTVSTHKRLAGKFRDGYPGAGKPAANSVCHGLR